MTTTEVQQRDVVKVWLRKFVKPEALSGYFMISPALFLLLVLLAYPFCLAVYISVTDRILGMPGKFVGIENYIKLLQDPLFLQTALNSLIYTVTTVSMKLLLGLVLAQLLNQQLRQPDPDR